MVLCLVIFVVMASSSGSKRHISMRRRPGKAPADDNDVAPTSQDCGVEDLLNQTRFFSQRSQMVEYASQFYARKILSPKTMSLSWFAQQGFQFQDHLVYQGLQQFVTLKGPYYDDVMKAFYSNLKVIEEGNLLSEVNNKKIIVTPCDWMLLARLKYDGVHLSYPNIPERLNYN